VGHGGDRPDLTGLSPARPGIPEYMVGLIVALLVIWAVLAVLGLVFKGLFWLFFIGLFLFLATSVIGFVRRRA